MAIDRHRFSTSLAAADLLAVWGSAAACVALARSIRVFALQSVGLEAELVPGAETSALLVVVDARGVHISGREYALVDELLRVLRRFPECPNHVCLARTERDGVELFP
jgi:hypothetical protein